MRQILLISITAMVLFAGCSSGSTQLMTVEESNAILRQVSPQIDSLDKVIASMAKISPIDQNIRLRLRGLLLNRILQAFAHQRNDDIVFRFLPTWGVYKETKSILGITTTNTINIDSGYMTANLKTLRFEVIEANRAEALLEIDGQGSIAVSGRYAGISASTIGVVQLSLSDQVGFVISTKGADALLFRPVPKPVKLKISMNIKLLEWYVPWTQEIELNTEDLIKPVTIPIALKSEISFPVPSTKPDKAGIEYAPRPLTISKSVVNATAGNVELKATIGFQKKQ